MLATERKTEIQEKGSRRRLSQIELVLLIILLTFGFTLRIWNISSVGLDHFDEGVYAFSALGLTDSNEPHRLYPGQFKISPPIFFSLIGFSYSIFGGPSDTAAILVNVLLGTVTIGLVWWIGRKWFNPQAGVGAAALLALSEYHIELSRTGLSDVAFALLFLLALATIVAAFQHKSIGSAIIAGLAVGLAWNTKYHGWFALLIAAVALFPFAWHLRTDGLFLRRSFFLLGIMAVVAVACYLPWALYVQSQPGGYAALTAYQRTMVNRHYWLTNLWWQAQNQLFFEGWLSRASVPIAFLSIVLVCPQRARKTFRFFFILLLLSVSALLIGSSGTAVLITVLGIPVLLRRPASFPSWLVLGWLAIWFFSTPLYRPYARLVLPFTIATYLVAGLWISTRMNEQLSQEGGGIACRPIWSVVVGTIVVIISAFLMTNPSNPWRPSRGMAEAAVAMEKIIPIGERVIVVGEPSLAFYLHLANRPAFERIEDPLLFENLETPVYLVTGVYADRAPTLREGLKKLNDRMVPLAKFPLIPKDIRVLDDFAPWEARLYNRLPDNTYDLNLYRLLPKS